MFDSLGELKFEDLKLGCGILDVREVALGWEKWLSYMGGRGFSLVGRDY